MSTDGLNHIFSLPWHNSNNLSHVIDSHNQSASIRVFQWTNGPVAPFHAVFASLKKYMEYISDFRLKIDPTEQQNDCMTFTPMKI